MTELRDEPVSGEFGLLLSRIMQKSVSGRITGGLVWEDGYFIAVLEGRPENLRAFMGAAHEDRSIGRPQKLSFVPVETRQFDSWACGPALADPDTVPLGRLIKSRKLKTEDALQRLRATLSGKVLAKTPPAVRSG